MVKNYGKKYAKFGYFSRILVVILSTLYKHSFAWHRGTLADCTDGASQGASHSSRTGHPFLERMQVLLMMGSYHMDRVGRAQQRAGEL